MNQAFNLLESPWIPCTYTDNSPATLGIRDVLTDAHQIHELHGTSPLETVALHRLLLAVLHRVFDGPRDWDEWNQLWEADRWDEKRLQSYLEKWQHCFNLFDSDHPFYQASDDRISEPRPINPLIHEIAQGNNATLFDHHLDEQNLALSPAKAARALLAIQAFGLGGIGMGRLYHTDAPCTGGVIFLVQGENLFETLALNLLKYPDEKLPGQAKEEDRPVWEMDDPFTPERSVPLGYLDYLTWQNRRILLYPESTENGPVVTAMTEAPALRLKDGILEPMMHYRDRGRSGLRPLSFCEGRALWRDSAALFQLHAEGYRPPLVFDWLAELVGRGYLEEYQTRRYMALGMSKSRAKVNFYRGERMPLPLSYLKDEMLAERLDEALKMAEDTGSQLWGAIRTLATYVLSPQADTEAGRQPAREDLNQLMEQWGVGRRYWAPLEPPFEAMMETLPQDMETALTKWQETLREAAWNAFDHIADHLSRDPRKLKAVVLARGQMAAGLRKALPALDQS